MKSNKYFLLSILLLILILFTDCKKTGFDPEIYTGKYSFTTITVEGVVNSESGLTMNKVSYDGSVELSYLKTHLTINYSPDLYIHPNVSEDGNLTCPECSVTPSDFFEGSFDKKDLNFTFGFYFIHHSGMRYFKQVIVSGRKK